MVNDNIEAKTFKDAIDMIDFRAIHKAMKVLKWKPIQERNGDLLFDVSTPIELRDTVFGLCDDASKQIIDGYDEQGGWKYSIETGGFIVTRTSHNDSTMEGWSIKFTVDTRFLVHR